MRELIHYIEKLNREAREHLKEEYNISNFDIPEFELINFFLIDKALNSNDSLFIKTLEQEQASLIYFPTVLSVAISLFFKNYCDNTTKYKIGEILQKDGIRFEIKNRSETGYDLWTDHKGGYTKVNVTNEQIKKYIVTNSDLSNRKVRTRFDQYRILFETIFEIEDFPSKFKYKAAIIVEKKDFLHELKHQDYTEIDLQKAIPMQWVTKTGTFTNTYIPIEPMVYLVPNYETLKKYVLPKDSKIETVISIGHNKYKDDILNRLKRDIYDETIPTGIIIGSEQIDDSGNQFLKWNWTYPEIAHFSSYRLPEIKSQEIKDSCFFKKIDDLYGFISETEQKYAINLSPFNRFKKYLYSLTFPTENNSRMLNHQEYIHHLMLNESRDLIEEQLFNQNKNPEEEIKLVQGLIGSIFDSFSNQKGKYLYDNDNYDIILVPNPDIHISTWQEEFMPKEHIKIQTIESFLEKHEDYSKTKNIILLSIFGYGLPYKVIRELNKTSHNFLFLTYPQEKDDLKNLINKYENDLIKEYTSSDRAQLSGIRLQARTKPVEISDVIEEISLRTETENKYYDHESVEVNYQIEFDESEEVMILEGAKSVLLENGSTKRKEKVSNLRPSDKVRIYLNASKEKLYKVAHEEDQEGRFIEIEEKSNLWKTCLLRYYKKQVQNDPFYNEESLLSELQKEGANIKTTTTIKKWLDIDDEEKFPNAQKSLIAIKNLIKDQQLDSNFDSVIQSRRIYRGVMIALGKDLSDEVMDYVISKGKVKGNLLKKFSDGEIKSFIKEAAPLRTITKIKISEHDEPT